MKYDKNNRRYHKSRSKRKATKAKKAGRANFRRYGTTYSRAINGPMAMRQIVKMRYSEDVSLTAGVALSNYDFRANSIYDPNLSGVGHQPLSHDQWANFYDHYVVLGAKIRVTLNQNYEGGVDNIFFSLALQDTNNVMTSQSMIREQPRTSWTMLSPPSAGKGTKTLTKFFSAKKFFGAKSVITWDKLSATFGTNPTEDALFRIFYQNTTSTTNVGLIANVIIDYIVLLSEPKVLVQS